MSSKSLIIALLGSLALAPAVLAAPGHDAGSPHRIAKNDHGDKGGGHGKGRDKGEKGERGRSHGKPEKRGEGPSEKRDRAPGHAAKDKGERKGHRFADRDRSEIVNYYRSEYRKGNCPPGLDRKNNGCLPPGQARKWAEGGYLPRDVRYYDLPPYLYERLAPAPYGYRYVEVYGDVLLIEVSTYLIVDMITLTF